MCLLPSISTVAKHVSPVMLMFDDEANGYRNQILPMAHSDLVVQRAICVVAAFHLSPIMPELRAPAESGRAAIISKLRHCSELDERTWTILILLIVGDLVTGHEHVLVLYRMLVSFLDARRQAQNDADGNSPSGLEKFLDYQSRLIAFFARPILEEATAIEGFTEALPAPLTSFEQYAPRCTTGSTAAQAHGDTISLVEDLLRRSTEIYVLRAGSHATEPPDQDYMASRLAGLRAAFAHIDLAASGTHTVVWPAFVGAAEAQTDADRQFFTAILKSIGDSTGYGNVLRGLEALPQIWERQGSQRWTAALPGLGTVVM